MKGSHILTITHAREGDRCISYSDQIFVTIPNWHVKHEINRVSKYFPGRLWTKTLAARILDGTDSSTLLPVYDICSSSKVSDLLFLQNSHIILKFLYSECDLRAAVHTFHNVDAMIAVKNTSLGVWPLENRWFSSGLIGERISSLKKPKKSRSHGWRIESMRTPFMK